MAMTNEQLTKWIDEIFGTIDEIKQNSGDISGLTRSVRQLREDLTATQADVTDLEEQTAGTVSLPKAALQHFTDGSATQALDLVADIIPVQAGTGDPSPTNVRAITGYSSVTAQAVNDNRLQPKSVDNNGIYLSALSDGKINVNGTAVADAYLAIFNGVSLSAIGLQIGDHVYLDSGDDDIAWNIVATVNGASQNKVLPASGRTANFTIGEGTTSLIVRLYVANGTTFTNKPIQAYMGTNNDGWLAYQANTATISLGSTVYGGTVNFATGELVVDKAIVDLGTLNWTYKDVENPYFYSEATSDIPLGTDMLCSSYKVVDPSTFATGADLVIERAYRTNDGLNIRDTNYTDATAFKAALDGVKLVYPLTTPTTTTLTPAQLQLLQGENNVSATSGPITLTYAPDNVLAEVYAYIQKRFDTLTASLAANRTTRKTTKTLTKKED